MLASKVYLHSLKTLAKQYPVRILLSERHLLPKIGPSISVLSETRREKSKDSFGFGSNGTVKSPIVLNRCLHTQAQKSINNEWNKQGGCICCQASKTKKAREANFGQGAYKLFTPSLFRTDTDRLNGQQHNIQPVRNFSTGMIQNAQKGPSLVKRLLWKVGIGRLRYNKTRMRVAAYKLYMCCDELVDHLEITEVLGLPDTFYSWYLSMELHVWLLMVRLLQEGEEGTFVKHMLVKALWDDVENRSKKLGHAAQTSARRIGIKEIGSHFQAALFAYDEGALSDDRVLAAAIWRIIFEMQDADPARLELVVAYVRKQLKHLDELQSEPILNKGQVTFLPLYGDDDVGDNKEKLEDILARSTV